LGGCKGWVGLQDGRWVGGVAAACRWGAEGLASAQPRQQPRPPFPPPSAPLPAALLPLPLPLLPRCPRCPWSPT
jgi:hypothetical protein